MGDDKNVRRAAKHRALNSFSEKINISEEDIYEAMREIQGYLDITASDFKELYAHSYRHALDRLTRSIKARDIMTTDVVSVLTTTPLPEVAAKMAEHAVSGVPVLDGDGKIAGIISERDFLKYMGAENATFMSIVANCLRGKNCAAVPIRKGVAADIMTQPAITMDEDAVLAEIASTLTENCINRLPVISRSSGKLAGILTRADLVHTHQRR